jgi:OOP family OmpA-OmpF porin
MKKITLTAVTAALMSGSVVSVPAFANDATEYDADAFIGASLSYSKLENLSLGGQDIEELGDADEFDDDRTSWKAFAGVWANDYLGLEAQYLNLGEYKQNNFSFDPSGFTAAVMLGLPAGEHSRVYVKGGQFWWNADVKAPLGYSDERDGTALFYGVGTTLAVLPNMNLRVEYERADFDEDNVEADVDFASVGLGVMF